MQIRSLFADDRAVSPVIGVILMVAITVILAAVIGTFVLGLGNETDEGPPAVSLALRFDDPQTMRVTHRSGDTFENSKVTVKVSSDPNPIYTGSAQGAWNNPTTQAWPSSVSAGDELVLYSGGTDHDGDVVRVIWSPGSDGDTAVLIKQEWPA